VEKKASRLEAVENKASRLEKEVTILQAFSEDAKYQRAAVLNEASRP
jgi:hypothetical protein